MKKNYIYIFVFFILLFNIVSKNVLAETIDCTADDTRACIIENDDIKLTIESLNYEYTDSGGTSKSYRLKSYTFNPTLSNEKVDYSEYKEQTGLDYNINAVGAMLNLDTKKIEEELKNNIDLTTHSGILKLNYNLQIKEPKKYTYNVSGDVLINHMMEAMIIILGSMDEAGNVSEDLEDKLSAITITDRNSAYISDATNIEESLDYLKVSANNNTYTFDNKIVTNQSDGSTLTETLGGIYVSSEDYFNLFLSTNYTIYGMADHESTDEESGETETIFPNIDSSVVDKVEDTKNNDVEKPTPLEKSQEENPKTGLISNILIIMSLLLAIILYFVMNKKQVKGKL